jgi:hypothetical protein
MMKITEKQLRKMIREAIGDGRRRRPTWAPKRRSKPDFSAKKPKASPYNAALAKLVKMGYKVSDKEKTPGAYKTWLDSTSENHIDFEDIVAAFPDGRLGGYRDEELMFSWGFMSPAGSMGVFVQAYRKGNAGEESRMGIDT